MRLFYILVAFILASSSVFAQSPPQRIGILTDGISENWTTLRDALLALAAGQNITLDFRIPSPATAEQQQELARQMLESGVSVLALCPVKPDTQADFLKELAGKTALVTLYTDAPDSGRRVFIGRDDQEVGRLFGELTKSIIPMGLQLMVFCNSPEDTATQARLGELRKQLENMYFMGEPKADSEDRMLASANMLDILKKRPEIACLVGLQDYHIRLMARAAIDAGRARMVRLVGFGATQEINRALEQGIVHGLVTDDLQATAPLIMNALTGLSKNDGSFVIPESGRINTPLTVLKTGSSVSVEETLNAVNVQIPGLSKTAPDKP